MRINRRKYLATTAGLATGLAGCMGGGSDGGGGGAQTTQTGDGTTRVTTNGGDPGKDEVVFLTDDSSPEWRKFYTKTATAFTQKTGIPVTFEFTGLGVGLAKRLTTLIQAGSPPTMFMSFPSQEGGTLYSQGMIEPVDGLMQKIQNQYGQLKESWKFKPGGKNHMAITNFLLYHDWYRTDLYPEKPANWGELLQMAKEADSDETRSAIVAAKSTGLSGSQYVNQAHAAGANAVVNEGGSGKFVMGDYKDTYVETLEFFDDLHQYSSTNADLSYGGASSTFGQGGAGYVVYPGSRPALIAATSNPDLVENITDHGFIAKEGEPRMSSVPLAEGVFVLSSDIAGEGSVEGAKKYLEFLFLDDMSRYVEWMNIDALHNLPPYPKVLESDTYRNSKPFQELPGLKRWFKNQVNNILPDAKRGAAIGQAAPYWGPMVGSQGFAQMMNDHLVQDKPAEKAFDDNLPTIKKAFDDVKSQVE